MRHLIRKQVVYAAVTLAVGSMLSACSVKAETNKSQMSIAEIRTTAIDETETGTASAESTGKDFSQMVNPIKAATPEDFEKLGITFELPTNEQWIKDPTYTTISDRTAQVRFHDAISDTDLVLRIGKEDIDVQSGIYYPFDDMKEESWFANTIEDGTYIDIKVQHAVSDGQLKGILASWHYKDFNYTLWGETADEAMDSSIAKLAAYIAEYMK